MRGAAPTTTARTDNRPGRRYAALVRLLRQVDLVRAEIVACGICATPMPTERRLEIESAAEGLCCEAQPYWDDFAAED